MVELNFLVGPSIEGLQEYFLVVLLGNKQIELNGLSNLPIRLSKDSNTNKMTPQNGKISFKAPSDPGSYEFVVYQFGLGKEMLGLPMVDNSFRMAIVVE